MSELELIDEKAKQIKKLDRIAWVITVVVWLLVGGMRRFKFHPGVDLSFLAGLNALFNTGVTIALIIAYYYIRQKKIEQHRKRIYVALFLSACFLISYVGYHFTNEEIVFCKVGTMKSIYYLILFSHIILAGASLPFILMTFIRGYVGEYVRHRKLSKWVYWVWLYVAITGPIVYFLLLPCR